MHMFDPVTVQISVDSHNIQRQRIQIHLVKPVIEGFSVEAVTSKTSADPDIENPSEKSPTKRLKVKS